MELPAGTGFLTLDEIAECYDVSDSMYKKLWDLTTKAAEAGKAQPLGGDGSNGTTEIPIVSEEYENNLARAWGKFTEAEQKELAAALALD